MESSRREWSVAVSRVGRTGGRAALAASCAASARPRVDRLPLYDNDRSTGPDSRAEHMLSTTDQHDRTTRVPRRPDAAATRGRATRGSSPCPTRRSTRRM